MLGFKYRKKDDGCVISLNGDLTVENIGLIKEKLQELYNEEDSVSIEIEEDSRLDFSFMQLLCSAHRTYSSAGKKLRFENASDGTLCEKVRALGFRRHTGCALDVDNTCLWVIREVQVG